VRVTLRVTLISDHERRRRAFGPDPTRWRPDGTDDDSNSRRRVGHVTISLPDDVKQISWAAEKLGIGTSTAYRLVAAGKIPGAFKVGAQWRISVPRFLAEVHGEPPAPDRP
jgi:excisionase family DNA binding protein